MNLGDEVTAQHLLPPRCWLGPIDSRVGQEHSVKVEKKAPGYPGAASRRKG